MKKFLINFFLIASTNVLAQKPSDVIEAGIRIKKDCKMYLEYSINDKLIKYDVTKSDPNPITLPPDAIFLPDLAGVNVFLRPLNPLNYKYTEEVVTKKDPINESAEENFASIFKVLESVAPNGFAPQSGAPKVGSFGWIYGQLKSISGKLKSDKKKEIKEIFTKLKDLDFLNATATTSSLNEIEKEIKLWETYFNELEKEIGTCSDDIANYSDTTESKFGAKFAMLFTLKELSMAEKAQRERFNGLQESFKLVRKTEAKALADGWYIKLKEVVVNTGEITTFTIKIYEGGYEVDDKGNIVAKESKEIIARNIKFRRFNHWIPEGSAGVAYTFIEYPTFGTGTDTTGSTIVSLAGNKTMSRVNFTAMLNFVFYTPNTMLNWVIQTGVGVNSEVPTLLIGTGFRSNLNGTRRFAITGGVAFTWVKNLTDLKVGDVISGTSDLEKDLSYQFNWPPKMYIGLQYNF